MTPSEIAYREAVRAIEGQEAALGGLRSRTSLVFSAATLSVAILGSSAIADGLGPAEWIGIGFLGAMAVVLGMIVIPRRWTSASDANSIVKWTDSHPDASADEVLRDLAIHLANAYRVNQPTLRQLQERFHLAVILALGSIVAFGFSLT